MNLFFSVVPGRTAALLAITLGAALPAAAQGPITLQSAIATAQRDGAQGKAAELTLQADRYRTRIFTSSLMPQVSLRATVPAYSSNIQQVIQPDGSTAFRAVNQTTTNLSLRVDQRLPMTGGTFSVASSLNRYERSGTPQQWNSVPFSFALSQPIFQQNTLKWQQKQEVVTAERAEKTYLASREGIALNTTNAFFDVYIAKLSLQNAVANAATNDTLYRINKNREEVGKIGNVDLLRSELQATNAQQHVSDSRITLERAAASLRIALHLPPGSPLDLEVALGLPPSFEVDTARAMSEAVKNLPSIDDMELSRIQADQRVNAAKLSNNINATVNASYGYNANGNGFGSTYDELLQAKSLSLGVSVPIMQWGQRKNDVNAAQADRERTLELAGANLETIRMDAYFAALELGQRRQSLISAARSDTLARKQFEGEYNRYIAGRSPTPDLMYNAQDQMNNSFNGYLNALRAYWVAYYSLRQKTLYDFEKGEPIR